jgi:hypothetical protein
MLDQDEGHAVAGGQGIKEPAAGVKSARRRSYSDDREVRKVTSMARR